MNYKITFQEMAQLGIELLKKQPPVTLDEAKAQAKWLKEQGGTKRNRKKK